MCHHPVGLSVLTYYWPQKVDSAVPETAEYRKDDYNTCLGNVIRPLYHVFAKVACFLLVQCFIFNLPRLYIHNISMGDHFLFSALSSIKA